MPGDLSLYNLPNGMSVHYLSKVDTDLVYREVFEEDVYRRHGITIRDEDCIFDIGANTGLFALLVDRVCRGATLYAFEPIPAVFAVLTRNLEQCHNIRVSSFNVGLSRTASTATFTFFPRLSCASTMHFNASEEEEQRARAFILEQFRHLPSRPLRYLLRLSPRFVRNAVARIVRRHYAKRELVTCRLETVSALMEQYEIERIDLLKVDAERSELEILEGIRDEDWPKIRQAVVEVHEGREAEIAVGQQLARHGFRVEMEQNPHFPNIVMLYAKRPADSSDPICSS